jgi:hypothetical protein
MLISMPHGTSTIFGVFQAILALLAKPDELSALVIKLPCGEKFASEIFRPKCGNALLHRKIGEAASLLNDNRINGFLAPLRERSLRGRCSQSENIE